MNWKRVLSILLIFNFIFTLLTATLPDSTLVVQAASGPQITTTLNDNSIQKGSKKTFDVWARNSAGDKIRATVTFNGEKISPTWEDDEKASYTLTFTKEGENIVIVSAASDGGKKKQLTYHINYQRAKEGEAIGTATWSVELFSIGCEYLVYPAEVEIYEGETAAEQLVRLLHANGLVGYYGGTVKSAFYLSYIADGNAGGQRYNGYQRSGTPASPKKINLSPNIPAILRSHLSDAMTYYDPNDYKKNWEGYIGEFVITNGSGWMYSVNHVFPNVGFSDTYLSDGDVIRVQFTLAYGADIGGYGAVGSNIPYVDGSLSGGFYSVADKDELTVAISSARASGHLSAGNVKKAYDNAISVCTTLNASQSSVDSAVKALKDALAKPDGESQTKQPGTTSSGEQNNQQSVNNQSTTKNQQGSNDQSTMKNPQDSNNQSTTKNQQNSNNQSTTKNQQNANNQQITGGDNQNTISGNSTENSSGGSLISAEASQGTDASKEQINQFLTVADGIVAWKKADNGAFQNEFLINDTYLELAGSTAGDWYPIGLSRLGIKDNYDAYLAVLKDCVEERYGENGKLSSAKATEWHRISLAILAAGGDPTNFGKDSHGNPINLIADGTYDRGKVTSLGRQGINGWIWGLITLDSMGYEIPEEAYYTRDDIIIEILKQQLSDGGFTLNGSSADPDITAMAVQALAPYYNQKETYRYTLKTSNQEVTKSVQQVIDEALACLSVQQLETGDYESWGTRNVESTCQVVVALCCLGINPLYDERFIKNGNTLLDGILLYQMSDGGFTHSFTFDPENPDSVPNESNTMAGEQVLYTMAALWRQAKGMRTLYDFREESSGENTQGVDNLHNNGDNVGDIVFTEEDKEMVDALPQELTTRQYVIVITLLEKLNNSVDFPEKDRYLSRLLAAKEKISAIQTEIDSINSDILQKLYPFDSMSLGDKGVIDEIYNRCMALSEYDREKIEHFEDVVKTKTKVDNLLRGVCISIVLIIIVAGLTVYLVKRVRKQRRRKEQEMEELAADYQDEDLSATGE